MKLNYVLAEFTQLLAVCKEQAYRQAQTASDFDGIAEDIAIIVNIEEQASRALLLLVRRLNAYVD